MITDSFTLFLILNMGTHTSFLAANRLLRGSRRTSWFAARRRMCLGNICIGVRLPPATVAETVCIMASSSLARHSTNSSTLISAAWRYPKQTHSKHWEFQSITSNFEELILSYCFTVANKKLWHDKYRYRKTAAVYLNNKMVKLLHGQMEAWLKAC